MKWTEQSITRALVQDEGPFPLRRQALAVPNVSWGFLNGYEADLLVVSKAGYMTEVEVKVSLADWKSDKRKVSKFLQLEAETTRTKRFYYAAPLELAQRWEEVGIPAYAGVLGADESKLNAGHIYWTTVRQATDTQARKLTDREQADLGRLGTMRYWDATKEKP